MAQQIINVGTTANDGTGDLLRNGFIKVNQNFTELYTNRISGSGTDNYIPRFNGTNALENSIIFDNGTNIGIGTTSPSVELALFNSSTPRFHLQNSTSGTGSTSGFQIALSSTDSYLWNFQNGANIFGTNNSEKMRITSGGNVGIGTTSPTAKLTAINNASGWAGWIENQDTTGNGSGLVVTGASNTGGISLFVRKQDGTGTFAVLGNGNVGIGTTSPSEQLTISSGNIEGFDNVNLSALNSTTNGTVVNINSKGTVGIIKMTTNGGERMRITSGGNVGIGTTNPTEKLHVAGVAQILDDGTRGRITFQISSAQNDLYSTTTGFDAYRNLKLISNELILSSGGTTERMRITSGGNVGIGTSSPTAAKFVLNSGTTNQNALINGDKIGFTRTSDSAEVVYFKKDTSLGAEGTANINGYDGIQFRTQGAESVKAIITSGGNVGIGTTNPTEKLHVAGVAQILDDGTRGRITFQISSAQNDLYSTTTGFDAYRNLKLISNELILSSGGTTERMRITSGGNVGIGTSSPTAAKFVLNSGTTNQNALINGDKIGFTRTSDSAEVVYFKKDTSLGAEGTANINGYDGIQFRTQGAESVKAIITSSGNVGIGTASPAGKLSLYDTTDVWLNVTRNSSFVNIGVDSTGTFYNTNSNHRFVYNSGSNEAMRITSGGELCVGTTTAVGAGLVNIKGAANTFNLLAIQNTFSGGGNFAVFLNPSGGQTGAITMLTTTSTLYATTSDYRLKQDFKNFNGLELLSKIKVYDYEWKSNKSRMNGVIAHELQEVVPYAVTGEKDGEQMQQVDYSKLVPILVQAIQEQQKQIKELQTLIN